MKKLIRILSIDGGGIKGILPGQILVHLEEKLQQLTGNPESRIADHFDLLAGTSTGGILTCILLAPGEEDPQKARFSAREAVELYLEKGGEIFNLPFWHRLRSVGGLADEKYPAGGIERNLRQYFENLRLSQLIKPCIITAYDIEKRKAHFFTQHDAKRRDSKDFYVKDVARSTSAAPTYFEAIQVKAGDETRFSLVDGGVFANNPALCAYAEARQMNFPETGQKPRAADMAILSIGCGSDEKPYPYSKAKAWGKIGWIKPVINIMMSGVSETVDFQLRQIYDAVEKPTQYLRLQPSLGNASPDMDDASRENLLNLAKAGEEAATRFESRLADFARFLI